MTRDEKLNVIADEIQSWLDWQEKERTREGLPCAQDTYLMRVPAWPSRGVLSEWVSVLRDKDKPRFMLVGFDQYSIYGGKGDVIGYYSSMEDAIKGAKKVRRDFYEVFNMDTCEWTYIDDQLEKINE